MEKTMQITLRPNYPRVDYSYAHGILEDLLGTDLISVIDAPFQHTGTEGLLEPEDGVYYCEYNGLPCLYFIWNRDSEWKAGLCVLIADTKALKYAIEKYNSKAKSI